MNRFPEQFLPFCQRKLAYGMILIIQNIKCGKTSGILAGGKLDFQRIAHERAPLYLVKIGLSVFDNHKLPIENTSAIHLLVNVG